MQGSAISFNNAEYTSLAVCDSPEQTGNTMRIEEIPDLIKILIILKKDDFLSSAFMKENGLKGLSKSGLLRKAIVTKIAFHLYRQENPKVIERLMDVDTQNFAKYDCYLFSEKGVFWRKVEPAQENSSSTILVAKREILDRNGTTDLSDILTQQSLSFLFEIDRDVSSLHARERRLVCEF